MKVSELIEKLKVCQPEDEICVHYHDGNASIIVKLDRLGPDTILEDEDGHKIFRYEANKYGPEYKAKSVILINC